MENTKLPLKEKVDKLYVFKMALGSIVAAVLYAIAVRCFIQAPGSNMLAGGVSGIAIIISRLIERAGGEQAIWYSIFYFALNLPIVYLAFRKVGKLYSLFTLITIGLTSLLVAIIPQGFFDFMQLNAENDMLLIAIAAGVFAGCSTGIALMTGGSGGGVDVIVTILNLKYGRKIGNYSFVINALILIVGGILFGVWRALLYTIVFMFVNSTFVNIIYIRNNKMMIQVVTTEKDKLSETIIANSRHGVTIFECEGAYTHTKRYEIQTIVLENEVKDLLKEISKIDQSAFIIITPVRTIKGNFFIPKYK